MGLTHTHTHYQLQSGSKREVSTPYTPLHTHTPHFSHIPLSLVLYTDMLSSLNDWRLKSSQGSLESLVKCLKMSVDVNILEHGEPGMGVSARAVHHDPTKELLEWLFFTLVLV